MIAKILVPVIAATVLFVCGTLIIDRISYFLIAGCNFLSWEEESKFDFEGITTPLRNDLFEWD
jgi:hypothetical protein